MNNYVILKWGSLKGYNFNEEFVKKHSEIVKEFEDVWDRIYENHCSATGGSEEVQKDNQLKQDMLNVLYKVFELGVPFQNGWDDTYYNSFNEIENYIMNYGVTE